MNFLHPEVLFLLILPLLLAVAAIVSARRKNSSWLALVSETHKAELLVRPAPWRRHFPTAFGLLALALVIIALARPYSGYTDRKDISMGRNIMLAIDVSRSMETRDVSPSRLEQARTAAYELMDALPDDNFGLIVFSGDAQLAVPLTHDHNALRESIEQIDRSWASYGGTNLNNVLSCALDTFKQHSPDTTNALIILSDGEDTVGNSLSLVERARKEHLIVITVGIGTKTGDVIPDAHDRTGLYRGNNGQNVISKLNDESLIKLAKSTDGQYYAINSGNALASFVRSATSKLEAEEQSDQTTKIPNDQYTLLAIPALISILLAIVIGTEWRSWKRKTALLLLFLLATPAAKAEDRTEQLLKALQNEQYEDIIRQLSDGSEDANPERQSRLQFAKGYAELKKNEPEQAKESFSQALLSSEPSIQASALYNIGNINIEQQFQTLRKLYAPGTSGQPATPAQPDITQLKNIKQQLEQDTQSYKDALQIQPEFASCRNNLNKTETFIRKLDQEIKRLEEEKKKQEEQQKQQQQQNQQDQKQDNDKNDQNKQDQKPGDNDKNDQNKQDQNSGDNDKNDQNKQNQKPGDNDKNDQNKQDQNSGDNDKNDHNKQDQNSGDDNKNNQNKQNQKPGDDNKNGQNKQNQKPGDDNKNDQNKQDQNSGDNDKNDQNKQDQNSGDNNKNDRNQQAPPSGEQGQPEPAQQQQPEKRPEPGNQQQAPSPEIELAPSQEAKEAGEKHRAAQILRMHTNEVKGAPYPTFKRPIAPPTKDY